MYGIRVYSIFILLHVVFPAPFNEKCLFSIDIPPFFVIDLLTIGAWLYFFFFWIIVYLKCCLSFQCIAKWFSNTYTNTHFFSDSFLIYVITEYWGEFPMLYTRALLAIYLKYNSVCMLIPSSWFIPPPHFSFGLHKFVSSIHKSVSVL